MNPDEIQEAAKEAGFSRDDVMPNSWMICPNEAVQRFAAIIEKRTIERCAKYVDEVCTYGDTHLLVKAIRKLGE